ncbi:MAG: dTMP kinase [Candidatus Rokubacteria bacterium]|nr:dTMP kinase [Candidatus Rokubacteria bacterium]
MRGCFITFEGVEGAGKTTHVRLLAEWLRQQHLGVVESREPDGTPLGEAILSIFHIEGVAISPLTELFLFEAARHQHLTELIEPALARGQVVLCDRFADSTLAYQGYGRGLDLEEVDKLNHWATLGMRPDLTILLDLEIPAAFERIRGRPLDRFEQAGLEFHERVRKGYLEIAAREPGRILPLAADRPVEAVQAEIRDRVMRLLHTRGIRS